jgi:hypothetical protein
VKSPYQNAEAPSLQKMVISVGGQMVRNPDLSRAPSPLTSVSNGSKKMVITRLIICSVEGKNAAALILIGSQAVTCSGPRSKDLAGIA